MDKRFVETSSERYPQITMPTSLQDTPPSFKRAYCSACCPSISSYQQPLKYLYLLAGLSLVFSLSTFITVACVAYNASQFMDTVPTSIDNFNLIPSVHAFMMTATNSGSLSGAASRASELLGALATVDWSDIPETCTEAEVCETTRDCSDEYKIQDVCENFTSDGGIFHPNQKCEWHTNGYYKYCTGNARKCSSYIKEKRCRQSPLASHTSRDIKNAFTRVKKRLEVIARDTKGSSQSSETSAFDITRWLKNQLDSDWGATADNISELITTAESWEWKDIMTLIKGDLYADKEAADVQNVLKMLKWYAQKTAEALSTV